MLIDELVELSSDDSGLFLEDDDILVNLLDNGDLRLTWLVRLDVREVWLWSNTWSTSDNVDSVLVNNDLFLILSDGLLKNNDLSNDELLLFDWESWEFLLQFFNLGLDYSDLLSDLSDLGLVNNDDVLELSDLDWLVWLN